MLAGLVGPVQSQLASSRISRPGRLRLIPNQPGGQSALLEAKKRGSAGDRAGQRPQQVFFRVCQLILVEHLGPARKIPMKTTRRLPLTVGLQTSNQILAHLGGIPPPVPEPASVKSALLVLALALPALAEEPVLRVQSIQAVDPKGQTQLLQKRPEDAKSYPVTINATGYVLDHFATSSNTMAALEFLIGGRVGINQSTDVEVLNERSLGDGQVPVKRMVLKNGSMWVKADAKTLKQPLEIQTNGGVMGIRGTEFTIHEEEDGTVEVNCFESNSEQGGVEIRDLNGQLVGTARPGDQVRVHRSRRAIFRRFQNISQYRQEILNGRRFQALSRNAYFNRRFLGGLGAMPTPELARAYFRAQQHRQLERNPFSRYQRTNPAHPGKRKAALAFISMTFPSRLRPDAGDPSQQAVGPYPRFDWLGVPGADGYLLTISRDEAGEENLFTQRVKHSKATYPIAMRPLASGRYYWRVTPVDAQDNPILEASQTAFDVR